MQDQLASKQLASAISQNHQLLRVIASSEIVLETLKGVPNKWQAHLGHVLLRPTRGNLRSFEMCGCISLINLIDREVGCINVGC